jgi:hypothetical protein
LLQPPNHNRVSFIINPRLFYLFVISAVNFDDDLVLQVAFCGVKLSSNTHTCDFSCNSFSAVGAALLCEILQVWFQCVQVCKARFVTPCSRCPSCAFCLWPTTLKSAAVIVSLPLVRSVALCFCSTQDIYFRSPHLCRCRSKTAESEQCQLAYRRPGSAGDIARGSVACFRRPAHVPQQL